MGKKKKKATGISSMVLLDPLEEISQMQRSMDRLFESMFPMSLEFPDISKRLSSTKDELKSTPTKYIAKLRMSGMKKQDFKIEVHPHLLRIMAQRKTESEKKNEYLSSSSYYSRQFVLADETNPQKVSAVYKNDVLTVEIGKAKKKKSKRIKVQ